MRGRCDSTIPVGQDSAVAGVFAPLNYVCVFKMWAAGSIVDDLLVCLVMSACLIPSIAIQAFLKLCVELPSLKPLRRLIATNVVAPDQ